MYLTKKLSEVARTIRGVTYEPDQIRSKGQWIACFRTKNIQKVLDEDDIYYIDPNILKNSNKILETGDILISSANSLEQLWKCCLIENLAYRATLWGFICAMRPNQSMLNYKYFYLFFSSDWVQRRIRTFSKKTTGIANLQLKDVEDLKIPLPPLPTQQKIVAKLDEAFANIDRQMALIKTNIEDVENMRKSVLDELISENNNFKKLEEIITAHDVWVVRWQGDQSDEFEIFYIKMNNLWNFNGRIVLDKIVKVNVSQAEKEKYILRKWDFLFNTRNSLELVWKTALFDVEWEYLFNNNILRIRFVPEVSPQYINYIFLTSFIQDQLHRMKSGTTNVSAIYFKNLKNLQIPLPSLLRQHEIVAYIDRVSAEMALLGWEYKAQIWDLEKLKQSLLHDAFAGKLIIE